MDTVNYKTKTCIHCKQSSELLLSKEGLDAWANGEYIQDAFPDMSADTRELIKTGIHPECWDDVFSDTQ